MTNELPKGNQGSEEEIKMAEDAMTRKQKTWSAIREPRAEYLKLLDIDNLEGVNVEWGPTVKRITWDDAVAKAKELGMRLPTVGELVYAKNEGISGFEEGYYWSSTDFGKDPNGKERVYSVLFHPDGTFGFTAAGFDYKSSLETARFVSYKKADIED